MLPTTLPQWLRVSLLSRANTSLVEVKGSNIGPRQMQDVKLNPAQRAEVVSKVTKHNPDAEWIAIEDCQDEDFQYEDGLCLEIWFFDGNIGEVDYDASLAKSRRERSALLQTLVSHLPSAPGPADHMLTKRKSSFLSPSTF